MTTHSTKKSEIKEKWILFDADNKVLGRLATEIAKSLIGKDNPLITTTMNTGAKVVVINSDKVAVTGKKTTDKIYNWHTGFPGGLKSATLGEMMKKDSTWVIREAVNGMLPKNKLRKERMANLYIYKDATHPHTSHFK